MSSNSGTQHPNVLNYALRVGRDLSVGVVVNARTNEARYAADANSPVVPNVLNGALPADGSLSMVVVPNSHTNEARAAIDAAAPVALNFLNDELPTLKQYIHGSFGKY